MTLFLAQPRELQQRAENEGEGKKGHTKLVTLSWKNASNEKEDGNIIVRLPLPYALPPMKYGPNGKRAAENSFKLLSSHCTTHYIAIARLSSYNYVSHLSNSVFEWHILRLLQMYHGAGTDSTHNQMCMVSCGLDKFVVTPSKCNDSVVTLSHWVWKVRPWKNYPG